MRLPNVKFTLSHRLIGAVFWSLGLSVAMNATSILTAPILARIMGPVSFGEWSAVQGTVLSITGIAQLSMAIAATKFVAELRDTSKERVGAILGLCGTITGMTGAAGALLMLAAADVLSVRVLQAPHLTPALMISAVSVVSIAANGYQMGALAGLERFRVLAMLQAAQGIATISVLPVAAWLAGVRGAASGYALVSVLSWVAHQWAMRAECAGAGIAIRLRGWRHHAGPVLNFILPATLAGIVSTFASWFTMVRLVRSEDGYLAMGIFSVAVTLHNLVLFAPTVVDRVLQPVLANLLGSGDLDSYQRVFRRNLRVNPAIALLVALPLGLGARPLLAVFGRGYLGGETVVAAMAACAVLEVLCAALTQRFLSAGRMWANLNVVSIRSVVLVTAGWVLAARYGATGLAAAHVLAYAVAVTVAWFLVELSLDTHGARERLQENAGEES